MTSLRAEDELGRKWDRCLTDTVLKFGGGVFLGTVFSIFFFKRSRWPVLLGGGFGIGMAYSNCERDINAYMSLSPTGPCEAKKIAKNSIK